VGVARKIAFGYPENVKAWKFPESLTHSGLFSFEIGHASVPTFSGSGRLQKQMPPSPRPRAGIRD